MRIVTGRWEKRALRRMAAMVACVLLPSLAPDTVGLACPHHAGHSGHVEEHGPDSSQGPDSQQAPDGPTHHSDGPSIPDGPAGYSDHASHPNTSRLHDAGSRAGTTQVSAHESLDAGAPTSDPGPAPCTCAGQCPISGAPPIPGRRLAVVPAVERAAAPVDIAPETPLTTPVPFVLPFANGPPLA